MAGRRRGGPITSLGQELALIIPQATGVQVAEYLRLRDAGKVERPDMDPEPPVCGACHDVGQVPAEPDPAKRAPDAPTLWVPCRECGAHSAHTAAQAEKLRKRFEDLGLSLPRLYREDADPPYTFATWPGADKRAKSQVMALAKGEPRTVLLLGAIGTGKTSLVACLWREWARTTPALWAAVPDLLDHIRQGFDREIKAFKSSEMVEAVSTAPLVMLDDIGPEHVTPFVEEVIYRIVGRRGDEKRPTIFTTNLTLAGLEEHVGGRIASRIEGMAGGVVISVKGDDIRKRARVAAAG